jgi:hypothetical protein
LDGWKGELDTITLVIGFCIGYLAAAVLVVFITSPRKRKPSAAV